MTDHELFIPILGLVAGAISIVTLILIRKNPHKNALSGLAAAVLFLVLVLCADSYARRDAAEPVAELPEVENL